MGPEKPVDGAIPLDVAERIDGAKHVDVAKRIDAAKHVEVAERLDPESDSRSTASAVVNSTLAAVGLSRQAPE